VQDAIDNLRAQARAGIEAVQNRVGSLDLERVHRLGSDGFSRRKIRELFSTYEDFSVRAKTTIHDMNSARAEEFVVALRETIVDLRKMDFSIRHEMTLNYTDLSFYDKLRNVTGYRLTLEQRMSTICEHGPAALELLQTMIGELARRSTLIRGIVMRLWAESKHPDSRGRLAYRLITKVRGRSDDP
jgi:hypothetical protein